jgi:4-amino-4-deoxy-L-arabinose transferase-like glycosyltransferase
VNRATAAGELCDDSGDLSRLGDALVLGSIGFALRLIVCLWAAERFPPAEDGHFYDVVGRRIADGLGYTWAWPDGAVTYAAHYPVGYPALVGASYAVFGGRPVVAMVLNAALGAAAVVAVHRVSARIADRRGALLAASIAAVHPALLFYVPALMTEAIAGSLWVCAAWIAVASHATFERRTWLRSTLLGVIGGVATLVRPQMIVVWPVLGLLVARKVGWRALGVGFSVGALSLALCAPWTVRNYMRFDRFVFVSANSGWNVLMGSAERASGAW